MALTESYLKLLKYVQEKKEISINDVAKKFNRNNSSIRREIDYLNIYLNNTEQLTIKNGYIISKLSYEEYLSFMKRLSLFDYASNQKERFNLIIMKCFVNQYVNTAQLYKDLNISLTTKKSDLKQLRIFLDSKGLSLTILHRKGIKIIGDELRYRILIIKILLPLIEINNNYVIEKRRANTPFDNQIVDAFFNEYQNIIDFCQKYVMEFIEEYNLHLTYSSKKSLVIYIAISNIRTKHENIFDLDNTPVNPLNLYLFNDANENRALNLMVALLDSQEPFEFPENIDLKQLCNQLVDELQKNFKTYLYTKNMIVEEIYLYIYKSIMGIYYDFSFQDKMVRDTYKQFPELYDNIKNAIQIIEKKYNIIFNEHHIVTMTLILRKWINKNKIAGSNQKKVVIVTNTSYERIAYFIEYIQEIIEVKIETILNINEIDLLKRINFDWVFTFSDRIQSIVQNMYPAIELNFFITDRDIDNLINHGFSRKHHKILASKFIEKIENKSNDEIIDILTHQYNDFFI